MDDQADALQARARARIGQSLRDKWRLDALLGVGGMAAVFAATHVNNGRRAAIKLLHAELSVTPEVRTRFLREGYLANKVEHPGAVGVLDDDVCEDGTVFLVMELLEGETLEDRRERRGALPAHEVLSLGDRLLDVLAAAHDRGIVHRDIKPENVFLTRDGSVKVLDFGIARIRELSTVRLTLTSAGAIGTPAFMPPEQARGRWDDVGPRSDIWAVGATMFTLASGRLVHHAETINELMLAAMTKTAPPVASVVPNLPPPVAEVIDRALAYDLNLRWPDARSMQTALRAAYRSFDGGSPVTGASGVLQGYQAPPALPPQGPVRADPQPLGFRPQAAGYAGHATSQPVTVVGAAGPAGVATAPARGSFPVLPLVGGLLGATVMGGVVLFAVSHQHGATPAATATTSATASADPAPELTASATASASVAASASASAPVAPEDRAPGAPATKPAQTPQPPKPRSGPALSKARN